jgi:hypothetical protein
MALIICAECGHKISDQATSCPSCGAPQKPIGAAQIDQAQYPNRLNDFWYRIEKDKSISAVNSRGEAFWKAAGGKDITPSPCVPATTRTSSKPSVPLLIVVGVLAVFVAIGIVREAFAPSSGGAKSACNNNWQKCTDNADLINHYWKTGEAQSACKQALDHSVKFGDPEWTWGAFGHFGRKMTTPKPAL